MEEEEDSHPPGPPWDEGLDRHAWTAGVSEHGGGLDKSTAVEDTVGGRGEGSHQEAA